MNLEAISNAEHVFGDGTFTYAPKFFMQLYTLHIYKNNFYIPLVYCFLRNKQTSSYLMLWNMLEKLCLQLTNKPLQINVFHVDFEKAAHNAVLEKFPNCVIVCCNFHLGQSWYRRIQQNKLLLKEYLNKSSEVGTWLKCFFGLSYLPPNEISDGFTDLLSIAPTNMFTEFTDYILENYILPDSAFPPVMWASAPSNNPKTTNGVESFHRHYNSQFYSPHPNMYLVIDTVLQIQTESELKLNSIKKNIINVQRKDTIEKINFLDKCFRQLCNKSINRLEYLKQIGSKYYSMQLH